MEVLSQMSDDVHMIIGAINVARETDDPDRYLDAHQLLERTIEEWQSKGRLLTFIEMLSSKTADTYNALARSRGIHFSELLMYEASRQIKT